MFISPQTAIDNGWITGIVDPAEQVQPNAIDFTLDTVYSINENATFVLGKKDKKMRGGDILPPDENGNWTIAPNTVHDGMSDMYANLPEDVAALLIIRSTLNRNGIFLTSGLYDSGFQGHVAFAIHNRSGIALIEKGVRFGQIIFVESASVGMYAGGYNNKLGTHHSN